MTIKRQSNKEKRYRIGTRGRKHPIKPDRYDGKSCIEAYLSKFESISEYNEWISCASQGVNISYQVGDLAVSEGQKVVVAFVLKHSQCIGSCSLEDILQGVWK